MPGTKVVTASAHLPVTMREAKDHLEEAQDRTEHDNNIWECLKAASDAVEIRSGEKLVDTTIDEYCDGFPGSDHFKLTYGPLKSITSLKYTDSDDSETTWGASNYFADTVSQPGRLYRAFGISWPSVTLKPKNAIVIRYVAGYGTAAEVPPGYRRAIKLILGELYFNRERTVVGQGLVSIALKAADNLVDQRRIRRF